MRVVLIQEVPNLGKVGDIKDVADGYGRNYLIPKGLAILATYGAVKNVEELRRAEAKKMARRVQDAESIATELNQLNLHFTARAGEEGRLYGSITNADIAEAIKAKTGHDIDRRRIELDEPIRHLGEHTVEVRLITNVSAHVKVTVEPEGGVVAVPAEAATPVAPAQPE
ncbi:MAG: 50S ribosomal protein L9 [Anaerolineae bacterium]|nr:50S ribosomal protein L9 [Anaerolineae bacterium]